MIKFVQIILFLYLIFIELSLCNRKKRLSRVGNRPDPPLKPFINSSNVYISYTSLLRGFINSQGFFNRSAPIPSNSTYASFMNTIGSLTPLNTTKIIDKNELSAFMAHVLVSSKGLTLASEENPSIMDSLTRSYMSRGYLGIKGVDDYRKASMDLYGDFRLLDKPELILQDDAINWQISVWNWKRFLTEPLNFSASAKALLGGSSACEVAYSVYVIFKREWDPKSEPFSKCKIEKK